jgi:ligand-binding SRPBCC domain-containing protein
VKEYIIERSTWSPLEISSVFGFFAAAENLGRITPPELDFRIRSTSPIRMAVGALIDYTIKLHHIPMRWRTEITRWDPPSSFQDTQIAGPYAKWVHTHRFVEDHTRGGTTIHDRVVYALPFGPLGRVLHPLVRRQLNRIFDYREAALRRELTDARDDRSRKIK